MRKEKRRFHFWHDWSKWEIGGETDILRSRDNLIVGKLIVQKRKCEECGLIYYNQQRIMI